MTRYKCEGTLFYEGTIEFLDDEKEVLKDYQSCIDSNADLEDVIQRILVETVVHDESWIEGIGSKGEVYLVHEGSGWSDNPDIEKVDE